MVDLLRSFDWPRREWLCRNCGEEYSSKRQPDNKMCMACRQETIWELPDDVTEMFRERLSSVEIGDEIAFGSDGGVPMKGRVTSIEDDAVMLDEEDEHPRKIDINSLEAFNPEDEYPSNNKVLHVDVTKAENVVEEVRVRATVDVEDIIQETVADAGIDPETVEVDAIRMAGDDLETAELKIRGVASE